MNEMASAFFNVEPMRKAKILATLLFFLGYIVAALLGLFDQVDNFELPSLGNTLIAEPGHAFGYQFFLIIILDLVFYGALVYGIASLVFWSVNKLLNRVRRTGGRQNG